MLTSVDAAAAVGREGKRCEQQPGPRDTRACGILSLSASLLLVEDLGGRNYSSIHNYKILKCFNFFI